MSHPTGKSNNAPTPPKGFANWLDYAVASFDTRSLEFEGLFAEGDHCAGWLIMEGLADADLLNVILERTVAQRYQVAIVLSDGRGLATCRASSVTVTVDQDHLSSSQGTYSFRTERPNPAMPQNIQIKARVADRSGLLKRATAPATGDPTEIHQDDTFFHCASGRLTLRDFGRGQGELMFDQRADGLGDCMELEVVPGDLDTPESGVEEAQALMASLGGESQDLMEGAYLDFLVARGVDHHNG